MFAAYEAKGGTLHDALDAISTNPKGLNVKAIGCLLRSRRNRNFGGRKLEGNTGGKQGMTYRVVRVDEQPVEVMEGLETLGSPVPAKKPAKKRMY